MVSLGVFLFMGRHNVTSRSSLHITHIDVCALFYLLHFIILLFPIELIWCLWRKECEDESKRIFYYYLRQMNIFVEHTPWFIIYSWNYFIIMYRHGHHCQTYICSCIHSYIHTLDSYLLCIVISVDFGCDYKHTHTHIYSDMQSSARAWKERERERQS